MPAPWTKTSAGRAGSKSRPPVAAKTGAPAPAISIDSALPRGPKSPVEVGDQVRGVLEPDRHAAHVLADAGGGELRRVHLLMRRRRRRSEERLVGKECVRTCW